MKSLRDILWIGSVLVVLTGSDSVLHAERGPAQELTPLPGIQKKTFDDLLDDPSAILDMDEEELTDLLPPIGKAQLDEPESIENPPAKAEAPKLPTAPGAKNGSLLTSPFPMVAIPTPPPPGMEPKTPLTMEASIGGLPFVLAPSFFVSSPGRNIAGAPQPLPEGNAMPPLRGVVDVSIILMDNQFYPSSIKLKDGVQTRLIFTTTNKRPAALVIERLQIQRWIAKEDEQKPSSENERIRWEVSRELNSSRVTEVVIDPREGVYPFHDAMTGATGEITVE